MTGMSKPFKVGDYVEKRVGRNRGETGVIRRIEHDPLAGTSAEVCFMAGYSQRCAMKEQRGFAVMAPALVRAIAVQGGHAAHKQGRAHGEGGTR